MVIVPHIMKKKTHKKAGRPPNIRKYKGIIDYCNYPQTNPSYRYVKHRFKCSQATINRAYKWKNKTKYKPRKYCNKCGKRFIPKNKYEDYCPPCKKIFYARIYRK